MDHLVVGVVLYRELLHRDSTLHLYANQVPGMKWRFGLLPVLEEGKVSQQWQQHMDVRNKEISSHCVNFTLEQIIRVKISWGLPPHALESLAKHWSVSAQLNIH